MAASAGRWSLATVVRLSFSSYVYSTLPVYWLTNPLPKQKTHAHTHTQTNTRAHTHTCTHMNKHQHTHTHPTHTHTHPRTHTHNTHAHTYTSPTQTHTYTRARTHRLIQTNTVYNMNICNHTYDIMYKFCDIYIYREREMARLVLFL